MRVVEQAGLTDVGRQRSGNEDSHYEAPPLFVVADGMGGARSGEVAAQMAVDVFAQAGETTGSAEALLERLVKEANRRIHELAQRDAAHAGMGCTLTSALVGDGEVTIGHVGDSRAYRLRDDRLEQLTRDHSLVEELVRQGKLTAEEAEVHPQRSIITRALGPEPDVEVDAFTFPARPGDVYLLCSDGLTGMVSDDDIAEILRSHDSLAEAAQALIDAANANGGRDNITVVLFRLGEDEDEDGDDADTLSGRETNVTLTVDDVRAAAARQEAEQRSAEATMVIDAQTAARARASPPGAPPRARRRRVLAVVAAVAVVAALLAGLYAGSRQFWFVGTNDQGLLTLNRGLPYELPLGIELYTEEYVSAVPARSITPARRRENVLDQRLRDRDDAVDLIRSYERPLGGGS